MNTPIYSFFNQSRPLSTPRYSLRIDAPRFVALCASFLAVWCVYVAAGVATGLVSAVLTTICTSPLFSYPAEDLEDGHDNEENSSSLLSRPSDVDDDTLSTISSNDEDDHTNEAENQRARNLPSRNRRSSLISQLIDQATAICIDDFDELLYVAHVLKENQGLLLLLLGGIFSMMMALLAGLDDVNVFKAFYLSTCCYGITTLLVAKSARRAGLQPSDSVDGGVKLSRHDIDIIMSSVAKEPFVPDDEMNNLDEKQTEKMIQHRRESGKKQIKCTKSVVSEETKQNSLQELRRLRNYNESCCICLATFKSGEMVRVLPNCNHEFHDECINQWAHTFAETGHYSSRNRGKFGNPTCPLCKTCFGLAPSKSV